MEKSSRAVTEVQPESRVSYFLIIVRLCLVFIVLCGILYPLVSTGLAQVFLPSQANGSLLKNDAGMVVGSELIGQSFTDPGLFHGRVSSIDYKAEASGSNNYAPSNPAMLQRTKDFIAQWHQDNPSIPLTQLPIRSPNM
ncbi:MAG: potassium-transporting ATPase subunit C [Gorillibacterium sp.]|nr:potassium-transporting ATPase subunit C [Gorillibacterium sp.]